MLKHGRSICGIFFLSLLLSSCIGGIWSGATAVYDRHAMYIKLRDYQLIAELNKVLAVDRTFNNNRCVIDMAAFNGDVLLAGHLPSEDYLSDLRQRVSTVKGYRRLFIEMTVAEMESNSIQDSWITTKIRSQIFADSSIDPNTFKIVTSDRVVYLMGDVKPDEAEKVIKIARFTTGVQRVVKLLKYFTYEDRAHK